MKDTECIFIVVALNALLTMLIGFKVFELV